jgi:hypothetical protein
VSGAVSDAITSGLALARAVADDDDEAADDAAELVLYGADPGPVAHFLAGAILDAVPDRTRTLRALGDLELPGRDRGMEPIVAVLACDDRATSKLLPMIDGDACKWLARALVIVLGDHDAAVARLDEAALFYGQLDALNADIARMESDLFGRLDG